MKRVNISKKIIREIIEWDFSTPFEIKNFLDDNYANNLFDYIDNLNFKKINKEYGKKMILEPYEIINDKNILGDFIELFTSSNFIITRLLSLKKGKKVFAIKNGCTKLHKYGYGDFHRIHTDLDYSLGPEKLLSKGISKSFNIVLSLSKGYKKGFGGELIFYKNECGKLIKIIELKPSFNSLWIYPLKGTYHEVLSIKEKELFFKYTITNLMYS